MLRMVVCDWNGTLFRDALDEAYFMGLSREVFVRAARRLQIARVALMLCASARCVAHYVSAKSRSEGALHRVLRIIQILNPAVFRGMSCAELADYTRRYARRVQGKLDRRLLDVLCAARSALRLPLGVISVGSAEGIEAVLAEAGCPFDFVLANRFRTTGGVVEGFDCALTEDKVGLLDRLLSRRGVDPADVMYIGDSWWDEQCFERVGMPVVSFWADDELKRRCAARYGAFAPETQADFDAYLRQAAKPA